MNSKWIRTGAAVLILAVMTILGANLVPIYVRNMELQSFVDETARDASNQTRPDDLLRIRVLQKAADLELPVKADNVQIRRSDSGFRIDVKYIVRVEFPLYTVDLHFYPGAGSR